MKTILISIRPEWVAKILNGEKTIEIRKTAPKCELPIDVYIHCTKSGYALFEDCCYGYPDSAFFLFRRHSEDEINGKVVAKFTMKEIYCYVNGFSGLDHDDYLRDGVLERSCLTEEQLEEYAPDLSFYKWNISDLVVFNKPMELKDFGLERAPQSWQYVEVQE